MKGESGDMRWSEQAVERAGICAGVSRLWRERGYAQSLCSPRSAEMFTEHFCSLRNSLCEHIPALSPIP